MSELFIENAVLVTPAEEVDGFISNVMRLEKKNAPYGEKTTPCRIVDCFFHGRTDAPVMFKFDESGKAEVDFCGYVFVPIEVLQAAFARNGWE